MEGIEARNNVKANGATIHQMLWVLLLFGTSKRKTEAEITHAREIAVAEYIDA